MVRNFATSIATVSRGLPVLILTIALAACGGGSEGPVSPPPSAGALADVAFTFRGSPALGERTSLALSTQSALQNLLSRGRDER
jgi:hypothetical protein